MSRAHCFVALPVSWNVASDMRLELEGGCRPCGVGKKLSIGFVSRWMGAAESGQVDHGDGVVRSGDGRPTFGSSPEKRLFV